MQAFGKKIILNICLLNALGAAVALANSAKQLRETAGSGEKKIGGGGGGNPRIVRLKAEDLTGGLIIDRSAYHQEKTISRGSHSEGKTILPPPVTLGKPYSSIVRSSST